METLANRPGFSYNGDTPEWVTVASMHRDSDALDRSNFQVMSEDITARFPEASDVCRFSHWAVGWTEELIVDPDHAGVMSTLSEYRDRLESYPILDDELYSEMEWADNHNINALTGEIRECYRTDGCSCGVEESY